ncbi:MAG: hypothetical protein P4L03_07105 [Terracidiphilus sp.]|nr:hypothetical protein [Terracidiphilus sp.]
MSRTFYLLAALLALFALVAVGLCFAPSSQQPGLPAAASPWRAGALLLALGALASALAGVLTHLFEQLDRRTEDRRLAERRARRQRP